MAMARWQGAGRDLRSAIRSMWTRPGFSLVVIVTLALGIGANTALFSIVDAVLLRRLAVPEPDRVVVLEERHDGWSTTLASAHAFLNWRERTTSFGALAATAWWDANLESSDEPLHLTMVYTMGDYFAALGIAPALGRAFSAEESGPGGASAVILSHGLWSRLGADPEVVGRTLTIGGVSFTVVGVMPPFDRLDVDQGWGDAWVPSPMNLENIRANPNGWRGFRVVARLQPGVAIERAQTELVGLSQQLRSEHPALYEGYRPVVRPLHDLLVGEVRPIVLVLWGAVALVLLIVCTNVATLLLAGGATRRKEMAVRLALGSGRQAMIRQMLLESAVLATLGAVVGIGLALLALRLFRAGYGDLLPGLDPRVLDGVVLAFTAAIAVVTVFLFGMAPALTAARTSPGAVLKDAAVGRASKGLDALVVAQVGLAALLLVGAGLMLKSIWKLMRVDTGLTTESVLTFDLNIPTSRYPTEVTRAAFFQALQARLETVSGVEAAGANRYFPLRPRQYSQPVLVEGRPVPEGHEPVVHYGGITSGYWSALGIPLLEGRDFTAQEMWETDGATIINRSLATLLFPGESSLGRRIQYGGEWRTIVGVVGDVRQRHLDERASPQVYSPYSEYPHTTMTFAVRTASSPESFVGAIRAEVRALDPAIAIFDVRPLEALVEGTVARRRLGAVLLGGFAALALALAAVGAYGVMAFSVSRRTRELGIRLALGAESATLARMVVREGGRLVLAGMALGLAAALALSRVLRSLLFDVPPFDPLTYVAVALLLLAAALVACYLPARRAARASPLAVLREVP